MEGERDVRVDLQGTASIHGRGLYLPWRDRVGGLWEDIGRLQFDYVTRTWGVEPQDAFLDVGCGPGRLAHLLVPYLAAGGGRYVGVDRDAYLLSKFPHEVGGSGYTLVCDGEFTFPGLAEGSFRWAWAQSVATHLPMADVARMLAGVRRMVTAGGEFALTYFPHPTEPARTTTEHTVRTWPDSDPFHARTADLVGAARLAGWSSARVERPERWPHPRGQRLLVLGA